MNKIPRVAAGVVLGGAAFYGMYEVIDQPAQETSAVEGVRNCAKVLGQQAVSANEINSVCHDYADQFTPTTVNGKVDSGRSISFRLPKPADLYDKELPNAFIIDQNVATHNANVKTSEVVVSGLVGLAIGLTIGTSKQLKKLEDRAPRQKKSAPLLPNSVQKAS